MFASTGLDIRPMPTSQPDLSAGNAPFSPKNDLDKKSFLLLSSL